MTFRRRNAQSERMPPAEPREPAVVPISSDPLAARLDRQCGEIRVSDEVARYARDRTEVGEDFPMPCTRSDRNGVRLVAEEIAKLDGAREGCRRMENPRMGSDTHKSAEDEIGEAECFQTGNHFLQPVAEARMVSGVFAVRVNQDVDVRENH